MTFYRCRDLLSRHLTECKHAGFWVVSWVSVLDFWWICWVDWTFISVHRFRLIVTWAAFLAPYTLSQDDGIPFRLFIGTSVFFCPENHTHHFVMWLTCPFSFRVWSYSQYRLSYCTSGSCFNHPKAWGWIWKPHQFGYFFMQISEMNEVEEMTVLLWAFWKCFFHNCRGFHSFWALTRLRLWVFCCVIGRHGFGIAWFFGRSLFNAWCLPPLTFSFSLTFIFTFISFAGGALPCTGLDFLICSTEFVIFMSWIGRGWCIFDSREKLVVDGIGLRFRG